MADARWADVCLAIAGPVDVRCASDACAGPMVLGGCRMVLGRWCAGLSGPMPAGPCGIDACWGRTERVGAITCGVNAGQCVLGQCGPMAVRAARC